MSVDPELQQLLAKFQAMPPVAALDLRVGAFDGDSLQLLAPLSRHVNDKGCAFGGSLVSLMTVASWALVTMRLQQAGMKAEVFVADSTVRYRAPLFDDLVAEARLEAGQSWSELSEALQRDGRATTFIEASVALPEGGVAAECRSRFVAVAGKT